MCLLIHRPPPGQWKKLNNNVIYFYQRALFDTSKLIFINVETKAQMDYSINIKNIGLLKTQRSSLIFIELSKETIISKLNTKTLTKKVFYRICRANLFAYLPIYHFQSNIIHTLSQNKIIQMRGNKLIRKYKGKFNEIAPDSIVIRLALKCFHESKFEASFFLRLWKVFEKAFNISITYLSKQYGIKTFCKYGDFIILSRNQYYEPGIILLPNYYIDVNYFIYGKGQKGMFCLAYNEKLQKIECFDNKIYLVIKQQNNIHVVRLKNNIRSFIFTKLNIEQYLIWPILTKNYLIFTNDQFQQHRDIPTYLKINLKDDL